MSTTSFISSDNVGIFTATTVSLSVITLSSLYLLYSRVLPTKPKVLQAGRDMFDGVKELYDASTGIWLLTWGEHMHSGWYEAGMDTKGWSKTQHLEAQDRMMVELLNVLPKSIENLAKDKSTFRILDCGCGVGGSSRFLYKHLTAKLKAVGSKCKVEVVGITLSPYQQNRATELTREAGIAESDVNFLVANALQTPFDNNSFDLVWSLESGEHMPGKFNWLTEIKRILKPGGRFLCACWCHRETQGAGKGPLAHDEKILLGRIAKNYSLPRFVPPSEYKDAAKELGLKGFSDRQTSFTKNVMPFWPAVVKSCLKPMSVIRLILALPFGGMTTIKGAITAYLMMQGFDKGTLEFAAFTVEK